MPAIRAKPFYRTLHSTGNRARKRYEDAWDRLRALIDLEAAILHPDWEVASSLDCIVASV